MNNREKIAEVIRNTPVDDMNTLFIRDIINCAKNIPELWSNTHMTGAWLEEEYKPELSDFDIEMLSRLYALGARFCVWMESDSLYSEERIRATSREDGLSEVCIVLKVKKPEGFEYNTMYYIPALLNGEKQKWLNTKY